MDLYSFINSQDIRNHLMLLNYRFDSLKASWLVYQSGRHSLEEKFDSWNWIIENMPDCVVRERINCSYRESLHETLKAYINLMKKYIREFYESEECVYTYGYYCIRDQDWNYDTGVYRSVKDCFEDLCYGYDEYGKEDYVDVIVARRSFSEDKRTVEAHFNNNKELLSIKTFGETDEESDLTVHFFEGMWFSFPTPFKTGDALIRYDDYAYPRDGHERGIMVMEGCTPEWLKQEAPQRIRSYIDGHDGDITDMNIWGYFQEEDGRIYSESTYNYMDFEYYRGSYEGKFRLMKALSSYMKGQIDLSMLLTAYRKVILDEFTNDIMLTNWFADKQLELAGLIDEQKKEG